MIDINFIRNFPDKFDKKQEMRGAYIKASDVLSVDKSVRENRTKLQKLQAERNALSLEQNPDESLRNRVKEIKKEIQNINDILTNLEAKQTELMMNIPNVISDDVEYGETDADNKEVRKVGEMRKFDFQPKSHDDVASALHVMHFDIAARISGSRFSVLSDKLAKLERGLVNFMLDMHTSEYGYREFSVPFLVKDIALLGTGQLPKFKEDLFKTVDNFWLIPTAEVYLTNLYREKILSLSELPIRLVAFTACFRSEAGAAGRDTKGIIRQHQFGKVELVSVVSPEKSYEELERMTSIAEEVLKRLGLHYRVVKLCSKDIGFSSAKTYDIEVWMPGQNRFVEISSCSNCLDFQARRMKMRIKTQDGTMLANTLNGSGVAVGRLIAALIENYQTKDGHISIPNALVPYVGFSVI